MTRRTYRLWHHWLSVLGGIFLLSYSITGLWHIPHQYLPWRSAPPYPQPPAPIAVDEIQVSSADLLDLAEAQVAGASAEIRSLSLQRIGTRPVYDLRSAEGRFMFDAETGAPFEVTASVAEDIIRVRYGLGDVPLETERIESHNFAYLNGPLPAYLFRSAAQPSWVYSVAEGNGAPGATTRGTRINRYITSLHALRPTRDLTGSIRVQHLSMLGTTFLCILLATTGFFLILPLPKWRRAKRVGGTESGEE